MRRPFLRRSLSGLFLFVSAVVCVASPTAGQPWPHEQSDLAPDPAIRWGRLDNGLRYVIRPNALPAGRVYLTLQVDAGSLLERDDQRGYAHFVEHMLFRGTRKFPNNRLTGFLQQEGLAMGADTSAFTNHRSTFYNLDLPQNSLEKISLGLSILRDFADGALFPKNDLKSEAKVVESERRTRESSITKLGDGVFAFHHPDSRHALRAPLGTTESILNATAKGLQEFYQTWYRPERLTVIAVGDAEPDVLARLIREQFSSLAPATRIAPVPPEISGGAPPADGVQAAFFPIPVPSGTTSLLSCLAVEPEIHDSAARRHRAMIINAACALMHARLVEVARDNPDDIGEASASWFIESERRLRASVSIDTRGAAWRRGLRLVEQELRRALLHGFNADEVQLFVQSQRNRFQQAIQTAQNRTSETLAQQIRGHLENHWVETNPTAEWSLAEPVLRELTAEACTEAFRTLWAPANRRIAVIGYQPAPLLPQELLAAYEESLSGSFQLGREKRTIADFDYTDFGPAGTIVRRQHDERIATESVTFTNGVALNIKRTDFEKNLVHLQLRLGRGLMAEPADQPGLGMLAASSFIAGGIGHYNNVELGRRLAGDELTFGFNVEEDACIFTGHASPQKLPKLLQVITAFLTDPAFRPEGYQQAIGRLQSYYPRVTREPVRFLRSYCPSIITLGDTRYGMPLLTQVSQREPNQVQDWLKLQLTQGRIEVGLAGDIDPEAAIDAVARTLGTLPVRDAQAAPTPERKPELARQSLQHLWQIAEAEPTKAAVHIYWPGVADDELRTSRQLQIVAQILNDRLRVKIREELGATYGPLHNVWGSNTWPGLGYVLVEIETAPKLVERIASLTRQTATEIARKGVSEEEFARALEPVIASLPERLRDNKYWTFHVLSQLQEKPERANWPLTRADDYRNMTRSDVEAVARRYLGGSVVHTFIAKPKP